MVVKDTRNILQYLYQKKPQQYQIDQLPLIMEIL
jgi:hypothetical protein